ncbi:MAG: hypothetical protein QF645_06045, partial [Planctomycetota bacterium]|nr:hypothetical protein [Planctomycetota bacterium]
MKVLFTGLIFGSVLFFMVPFQAEAQGIQIEYKKQTSNSELTINYSSGGYWGCGSGYFNRGYSYGVGSSYIYKGTYSAGYSSFSPYRYYAPSYRSYFYMPRSVYHYSPQYLVSEGGDLRFARTRVLKEWEAG